MIGQLIGGVGLFLVGMILMTDGLKAAAGDSIRVILARFTTKPLKALLTGTLVTTMVQSSSATTLATIGFVSAGLLSFPAAIGVILGSNLGSTSTGWLVSLLGFKLKIAVIAMPLIGVGALMRLMLQGRWGHYGMALAGFGLIFVGIDVLQGGMAGLATRIDPASFPQGPFLGRLGLIAIGFVMTVVMQSSGAAVATTMTALHSGAITLEQGVALVIGQNVGTTIKALLASIGGVVAVRRTAMAHVYFNVASAVVAFILIEPFLWFITQVLDVSDPGNGALALAIFHTGFNILGVAIFFPIVTPFAEFIARKIPEKQGVNRATRFLDETVAATGPVAVEAARRALVQIEYDLLAALDGAAKNKTYVPPDLAMPREGLADVRRFLGRVTSLGSEGDGAHAQHLSAMHALDHLEQLADAVAKQEHGPALSRVAHGPERLTGISGALRAGLAGQALDPAELPVAGAQALSRETAEWRRTTRATMLEDSAAGRFPPDQVLPALDAIRWVDQLAYHSWRAITHLAETNTYDAPEAASVDR